MDAEDGHLFIKNLAQFVRTHEKALANALQLQRQAPRRGQASIGGNTPTSPTFPTSSSSTAATIAAALSLPYLNFTSANSLKPVKLTLTPHHLFYLLSRFEELNVAVGPMNVRLENLHSDSSPAEYVSFLNQAQRRKNIKSSDRDSIHSVSSLRSVMSGMSSFWSSFSLSSKSAAKTEKQRLALTEDLKYLYSAFTKIPCLKLAPDHKARLIAGYEEFPFDTAVPLFAFKNLSALEVCDVDFRQFYGWDRIADQLRSLTVKRAHLDDPIDLLVNIVLDDMDKRRRKAAKAPGSPTTPVPTLSPRPRHADLATYSPEADSPPVHNRRVSCDELRKVDLTVDGSPAARPSTRARPRSASPTRPSSSRRGSGHPNRNSMSQLRRSSGSSGSSLRSNNNTPRGSTSNLLSFSTLPSTKWRFLRHLSVADNALTSLSAASLAPLANTLQSLDLSSNLFTEIPDSLATLTHLRALNLSNCMIDSLHSLLRNPLPAVTTLNLRHNRLSSLAGIERLLPLERVDFRDNRLTDPTEMARLTGLPEIHEIWVNRNPFTKSHSNFRITIFNLFRSTPGYTDDIILDASPPSYSERKVLVDRAPEPIAVPVVKLPVEEDMISKLPALTPIPSVVSERTMVEDALQKKQPVRPPVEYSVASQKKRKGTRRRIVELSKQEEDITQELAQAVSDMSLAVQTPQLPPPSPDVFAPVERSAPLLQASPQAHTRVAPPLDPELSAAQKRALLPPITLDTNTRADSAPLPSRAMSDLPVGGSDTYKKKIEALRNDLGPAWLSALTDERWDSGPTVGGLSHPSPMAPLGPPAMPVRTHSQGIVTAGRTLG